MKDNTYNLLQWADETGPLGREAALIAVREELEKLAFELELKYYIEAKETHKNGKLFHYQMVVVKMTKAEASAKGPIRHTVDGIIALHGPYKREEVIPEFIRRLSAYQYRDTQTAIEELKEILL